MGSTTKVFKTDGIGWLPDVQDTRCEVNPSPPSSSSPSLPKLLECPQRSPRVSPSHVAIAATQDAPVPPVPDHSKSALAKRRSMSLLSSQSETHIKAYQMRKSFTRPKNWVLLFGWFLASCAGFVNTVTYLKWQMFVSHMTGTSTKIGMHLEGYDNGDNTHWEVCKAVGLVIAFVLGAFTCGLLIDKNQVHFGGKSWYGLALVLNGVLLITATLLPEMPTTSCYLSAMACGLQNAMCTSHFGAVVRTTHVTGTLTDIGSILGRIAVMYIRKGCRGSRFNVLEKAERGVDLRKLLVLLPMWIFFLLGTIFGAFAERLLDKDALFIPAFATTFLGVVYMTLRQVLSDLFQRLEKQSLRERLREVHCAFARAGTRIAEGESDELDEIDEEIGEIMLTLGEVETTAGNTQVN